MKDVAKIGVAKVKTVLVDLSKLSNVVDNNVVKKTVYKKLVTKVNSIGFVLKTKYDTGKSNLENKISDAEKRIPDTSGLVKKQIIVHSEIEGKIPRIIGLATNSTLTAVENRILDLNSFVMKTDYDTKISEIGNKISDYDHDEQITIL